MERDLSTASWRDEPARANAADGRRPAVDGLLVAVARRICGQAERQLALAEWLRQQAGRADLADRSAELALAARRILRDGESLLVLGGGSPERGGAVPTGLGRILADVAASADDPARVIVAQVPSAALAQSSAIGAGQVLVELVAHARRVAPDGARIELVGRWAGDGGVTVEVQVEGADIPWQEAAALENELAGGPDGPIPPERLGLHLAARLARGCGARVEVQTPLGEPSTPGYGIVALVRFPRDLVEPAPSFGSRPADSHPTPPTAAPRGASALDFPAAAPQPQATASELFGSFSSPLARADDDDLSGTPIFAAVASAWFRTGEDAANGHGGSNGSGSNLVNGSGGPGASNGAWRPDEPAGSRRARGTDAVASEEWASAADDEWQAAARRAAQAEEEQNLPTTASGLPRRTPGSRMVAPSLRSQPGQPTRTRGGSAERAPERVRSRLATYQRGLQAGRHRAADTDEEEAPQVPPQPRPRRRAGSAGEGGGAAEGGGAGEGHGAADVERTAGWGARPEPPSRDLWAERRDPWTGEGLWGDNDPR